MTRRRFVVRPGAAGDLSRRPQHRRPPSSGPHLRHQLRSNISAWEAIGASRHVLRIIKEGARIQWRSGRPPSRFHLCSSLGPDQLTPAQREWLEEELTRLLKAGAIETPTIATGSHVCRAFLVPKPNKENSWRLVIDLRPINRFRHAPSTRFETLKRLRTLAQPDDWLVSFDLQDGFYAVGVHPADRRYLQFQIGDRLFQFAALPVGWNASPGLFCQVMNARTKFLGSPQRRDKVFRRLPRDQQDHLAQLREVLGGAGLVARAEDPALHGRLPHHVRG